MSEVFEKEKERKLWESIVQKKEYKKKLEDCHPDLRQIRAVVGASGFGAGKAWKDKLWTASVTLTAWREEESGELHREEILLSTPADDALLEQLRSSVERDSLIRCSVYPARNGSFLLLAGPVQAGEDPGLEEILKEQVREVTMEVEGLGTFTLDREVGWFETGVDWLGERISLSFDQDGKEIMEQAAKTARILMADQAGWDQKVREYAAEKLLQLANDWAEDAADAEELDRLEETGGQLVSREQFMECMELESIQAEEDGGFEFWFGDGDLFWGHSVCVSGNVEDGPDWADIEG